MMVLQADSLAAAAGQAASKAASKAAFDIQAALGDAMGKVSSWVESVVADLPNLIAAVVVLIIFWLVARAVRGLVARIARRFADQPEINRLVASAAFGVVLAIGLVLALGVLHLDKTVTSLLAGAGILGLAVGFAFQNIAENFLAGILLNVRNQFSEGDIIESNDFMGAVEHVDLRATVLRTFTGERVLIPNAQVYKNPITNYSQTSHRRVDIGVGVNYGEDLEKAKRVAIAAVEDVAGRERSRDVELFYEEFGDSSINFQLRFWIPFKRQTDYLSARSDAIQAIKRAFDENDIVIPFPIRTLDFAGGEVGGQSLATALQQGRR